MKNKKEISAAEDKLITALSSHFATLSPEEAEERIKKLREFVNADCGGESHTGSHSTLESQGRTGVFPLAARQRS